MRGLSWILWVKLEYNHKGPYEREAGESKSEDQRRRCDNGSRSWTNVGP